MARLDWIGRRWRRGTLRGRRGTCWHPLSFHLAGVALCDIHLRFAWQAWHFGNWSGSGGALGLDWSPVTPRHFAWQAWHLVTSTFVSPGRCGTWWHPPSFRVAGMALGDIHLRFAWQAWHLAISTFVLSHTIFVTHNFVTHNFVTHHLSHTSLSHTIFDTPLCHTPSLTQHFVTHHLSHTALSHTIFHTPSQTIFHTPSFTHHIVTRHLSHTTLSHTIFDTPLCHTLSFTHHLSHTTLSHTICHTPSFTQHFVSHHLSPHHLSHTTLSHTIFPTQLCHTLSFMHNFHTHTPSFTHNFVTHTIFLCHTPAFTYNFVTHNFVLLLDPPPPPLSFLPSPSPLQHLLLIIGRSCLVGLSGPLILCSHPQSPSFPVSSPDAEKAPRPQSGCPGPRKRPSRYSTRSLKPLNAFADGPGIAVFRGPRWWSRQTWASGSACGLPLRLPPQTHPSHGWPRTTKSGHWKYLIGNWAMD